MVDKQGKEGASSWPCIGSLRAVVEVLGGLKSGLSYKLHCFWSKGVGGGFSGVIRSDLGVNLRQ